MEKADITKRIDTLRDNSQKNPDKKNLKNSNEKECPFRDKVCGPHCKLFRLNKPGYECPFQEIPSMSWDLKSFVKKMLG